MKRKLILAVALAAVMISPVACKKNETTDAAKPAAGTVTTLPADGVLEINGETLKKSDVEAAAKQLPPQMQQMMEAPGGKRALGDELVRMKVLEQEGRRLKVQDDPEVDRAIKFETAKIVASAALKKLATPPDAELRQQYEKVKADYDLVQARQIVIAYKGGQLPSRSGAPLTVDGAAKKAEELIARLKAGEPFEKLLAASDDPRIDENKGTIGFIVGAAPPPIAAALANMKPGDVSAPIRTTIGVHVMQLVSRAPEPFERVKDSLIQRAQQERMEKVIDDLKKKAKVTYDEKYFGPEVKEPEVKNPS